MGRCLRCAINCGQGNEDCENAGLGWPQAPSPGGCGTIIRAPALPIPGCRGPAPRARGPDAVYQIRRQKVLYLASSHRCLHGLGEPFARNGKVRLALHRKVAVYCRCQHRRAVCRTVHGFPDVQTRVAGLAKTGSPATPARPLRRFAAHATTASPLQGPPAVNHLLAWRMPVRMAAGENRWRRASHPARPSGREGASAALSDFW